MVTWLWISTGSRARTAPEGLVGRQQRECRQKGHRRVWQEWEQQERHRAQRGVQAFAPTHLPTRLAKYTKKCGSNYDWQIFTYQKFLSGFLSNSMTNITKMRGAYL